MRANRARCDPSVGSARLAAGWALAFNLLWRQANVHHLGGSSMPKQRALDVGLRSQAAIVRTLADELELLLPHGGMGMHGQIAEELARLGRQILETAELLAGEGEDE